MSEILRAFYHSYKAWLNAGAPQDQPYSRGRGLCHARRVFILTQGLEYQYSHLYSVCDEMRKQFEAAGLDQEFPFNEPDHEILNYYMESARQEIHLNPARVAWVISHAKGADDMEVTHVKNG